MAIEEELSLNIESALEAIDRMAQGLQDALIGFFAAFDDAVKQLGSAAIPLPFEAEVEGGQQPVFEEEQDIAVDASEGSASGAAEGISEDLSQIEGAASVDVEGDASGLRTEVSDAVQIDEQPEITVGIDADVEAAQASTDSYKDSAEEPIVIEASVEDSGSVNELAAGLDSAQENASGVADSLNEASNAGQQTSESVQEVSQSTAKAKEEAEELETAWGRIALVGAQVFAGLVAATAAAATGYAQAAIQFEGAYTGFKNQLGDLGNELLQIDVQGFSSDLGSLVQGLGSSDEAVLAVSQRVALLGQNAGATNEEIAQTNSNLIGVAAAIRSTNPQLGELDQIANKLANGFQRGVSTLGRLGVNLTDTEVRLRASIQTGRGASAEFSRFELTAAAASLAAEQFGDSIKTNIEEAAKNPIIAVERMAEVFGDAVEQIGRPLVAPFLQALEDGTPLVLEFLDVVANFAESFFPFVDQAIRLGNELTKPLTDSANRVTSDLIPAFEEFAEALGNVILGLEPFILAITTLSQTTISAFAVVLEGLSSVINFLGEDIVGLLLGITLLVTNFKRLGDMILFVNGLLITNPYFAIAAAVGLIGAAFVSLESGPDPFDKIVDSGTAALVVIEDIPPAIEQLTESLEEYLRVEEILEDQKLLESLSDVGITVDRFIELVSQGETGIRDFVRLLLESGDAALYAAGGVEVTTENIDSLSDADLRWITTHEGFISALFDRDNATQTVIRSYNNLTDSTEATRQALFNQAAAISGFTPQLVDLFVKNNTLADGTINYAGALEELQERVERNIGAQTRLDEANGTTAERNRIFAEGISSLAAEIAAGTITVENFASALGTADIPADELKTIVENLTAEMNAFVDSAVERVPTVAEAFKELGPEKTAQSLIDSFNTQIDATNRWNAEMTRLRRDGQNDILKVVAELGPQQGLLLLDTYQNNETILADHLRNMAAAEQAALQTTREVAVLNWLALREITGAAAEAVVAELEGSLTLADATEASINEAIQNVQEKSPELAAEFGQAGADAANELTVQSAEELNAKAAELNQAVEAVWSGAGGIAETASRIAAEAGVNKFNEIISSGFLNEATANAIVGRTAGFFSVAGLGVGSAFGDGVRFGYLMQEASIIGTVNISINSIYLRTAVTAFETGELIGAAIVNGIRAEFVFAKNEGIMSETFVQVLDAFQEDIRFYAFSTGGGIGSSFVEGLRGAISAGSSSISRAARQIIADAESAAKDEAESDSPSKVWERLGRDLVSGLANGLRGSSFLASGAAAGVINQATPAVSGPTNNNISISVPVTVSGNVDPALGREIGQRAAAEISRVMRLEARMA